MIPRHHSHRGFSLTEVLMAAGILGVGMTMVASVFPVAVDQSRLSGDTTMAALSARSVAAVLRARREQFLQQCRQTQDERDPRDTTTLMDDTALPDELRCYNPHRFLYRPSQGSGANDLQRSYETPGNQSSRDFLWSAGSYVPVVFATPMNTLIGGTRTDASEGPWRITIVIYKSQGRPPAEMTGGSGQEEIPFVRWATRDGQGEPGDYIMDVTDVSGGRTNYRGEAYKVSRIHHGTMGDDPADDKIFPVAAVEESARTPQAYAADRVITLSLRGGRTTIGEWLSLRGAVAVYHTILGD